MTSIPSTVPNTPSIPQSCPKGCLTPPLSPKIVPNPPKQTVKPIPTNPQLKIIPKPYLHDPKSLQFRSEKSLQFRWISIRYPIRPTPKSRFPTHVVPSHLPQPEITGGDAIRLRRWGVESAGLRGGYGWPCLPFSPEWKPEESSAADLLTSVKTISYQWLVSCFLLK